ncbi:MAG: Gfo/Idh/MocA family oxidoreductase [candidate division Zixibacteria bacterium]|nr:Gfo/Idh/MocA family oxidoreductase [candidate division Zixibacteria bacterium]
MIRAGFIGAGSRAQGAHYPNVHRLSGVEMTAVCEIDEARLKQVQERYGFRHVFTDHQKMLETVELDVIYCIMHERWLLRPALDVLNAGKHILMEKPPGANSDETRQLLEAAVKNDVYAMVAYQRRYTAIVQEAMRRVAEKGPVSLATATFNKQMLGDFQTFSTTLWDDVTHIVDLVRFMCGGEPVEVTRYRDALGSSHWNCYTALIRFDNGATGVVFGNRASGGRVLRAELHGVGVGCYMKLPEEIEIHEDNRKETLGGWEPGGALQTDTDRYEGVLTMHEHFIDCVVNRRTPSSDLRDVIHTIRLVDWIENGRPD